MFKKFSLVLGFVLATCSFSPSYAAPSKAEIEAKCLPLGMVVYQVATMRDNGVSEARAFDFILSKGLPEKAAEEMLSITYLEFPFISPIDSAKVFVEVCAERMLQKKV